VVEAFCEHLPLELELARRTPPAFLVAFGLMAEFVTKDLMAQARPSMCSAQPGDRNSQCSGSSYQFLGQTVLEALRCSCVPEISLQSVPNLPSLFHNPSTLFSVLLQVFPLSFSLPISNQLPFHPQISFCSIPPQQSWPKKFPPSKQLMPSSCSMPCNTSRAPL
jgi:hypothetical protein